MTFIIILIAVVAGFAVGSILAETLFVYQEKDISGQWEFIPLPDGQRPERFIISEKRSPNAHILDSEGQVLNHPCFLTSASWIKGAAGYNHHGSCDFSFNWGGAVGNAEITNLPGNVVDKLYCSHTGAGGGDACLYVILENDEIWRWSKPIAGFNDEFFQKMEAIAFGGIIGRLVCGILGTVAVILVLRKIRRYASASQEDKTNH